MNANNKSRDLGDKINKLFQMAMINLLLLKWKQSCCGKLLSLTSLFLFSHLNLWGMVTCAGMMHFGLLALQSLVKLQSREREAKMLQPL